MPVTTELLMPRLSDSMEEGTVVLWLRGVGDLVGVGDPIAEIETDKATMALEAEAAGTLLRILVEAGQTVPLGAVLAVVGEAGAVLADAAPATVQGSPAAELSSAAHLPAAAQGSPAAERPPAAATARAGRTPATPVARRLARELGVELAALQGTGPRGRVRKDDVLAAAVLPAAPATTTANGRSTGAPVAPPVPVAAPAAPAPAPPALAPPTPAAPTAAPPAAVAPAPAGRGESTTQPLTRVQTTIARRMAESKATIPEFALWMDVDMRACVALRTQLKQLSDRAPSYNDMIVKAAALALRERPQANASWRDGAVELHGRVNVGVAVAADGALVVPTVFDADTRSLGDVARETRRLAAAVRDGTIAPPELSGGTFTVSNLGMYGVRAFAAIVNPPQAAILSVGELARRPAVAPDGSLFAREELTLGLISDHRVLYGADAAHFLARIRELLEQPLAMAL